MNDGDRFIPHSQFIASLIPEAIERSPLLSPIDKLVWGRLARFAGENGYCWPRTDTLAEALAVSRRQVRRAIVKLVKHKLIEQDGAEKGPNRRYHFTWSVAILGPGAPELAPNSQPDRNPDPDAPNEPGNTGEARRRDSESDVTPAHIEHTDVTPAHIGCALVSTAPPDFSLQPPTNTGVTARAARPKRIIKRIKKERVPHTGSEQGQFGFHQQVPRKPPQREKRALSNCPDCGGTGMSQVTDPANPQASFVEKCRCRFREERRA